MEISSVNHLNGVDWINTRPIREHMSGGTLVFPKAFVGKDFDENIKNSKLDDCVPNKSWLNKKGFNVPFKGAKIGRFETKDSLYIQDMNGGRTYQNKNGDTIRISEFEGEFATGLKGSKQVEYKSKDGKTADTVIFDPDGNPLKGYLTVKKDDGTIIKYQYEYDENGNKQVKNKSVEFPDNKYINH